MKKYKGPLRDKPIAVRTGRRTKIFYPRFFKRFWLWRLLARFF